MSISTKALDFERKIFYELSQCSSYNASHEGNDSKKSDIKISYQESTYIEVKLNYRAQFGTPRLKYENGTWSGVSNNPITEYVSCKMNDCSISKEIVYKIEEADAKINSWIGYNKSHYKNQTNNVEIKDKDISLMLSYKSVQETMKKIGNQYIYPVVVCDDIVPNLLSYYNKKGALFSQIGDCFYKLADVDCEPYGIKNEVPLLTSDAKMDVRFTFRKSDKWIETIPTIKLLNPVMSNYSLLGKQTPLIKYLKRGM